MHGVLSLQQLNLQLFPSPVQLVNPVLQGWRKGHALSSELAFCTAESLKHVLERCDSFLEILQDTNIMDCRTQKRRNESKVIEVDLDKFPK